MNRGPTAQDSVGTSASPATDAIVVGWEAAFSAFDSAARSDDWQSPALAATYVEPQLDSIRTNLRVDLLNGDVSVGSDRIVNARVLSASAGSAELRACVQGGEILVGAATGDAVAGVSGEVGPEEVSADLVNSPSGWKVERQTVAEGSCDAP